MSDKKILTIERSKWLRGEGTRDSSLYRPEDGKMCCLGFDALAHGLTLDDIAHCKMPLHVSLRHAEFLSRFVDRDTIDALYNAAYTNDDPSLPEETRESEVRKQLQRLGWDDVVFVD